MWTCGTALGRRIIDTKVKRLCQGEGKLGIELLIDGNLKLEGGEKGERKVQPHSKGLEAGIHEAGGRGGCGLQLQNLKKTGTIQCEAGECSEITGVARFTMGGNLVF